MNLILYSLLAGTASAGISEEDWTVDPNDMFDDSSSECANMYDYYEGRDYWACVARWADSADNTRCSMDYTPADMDWDEAGCQLYVPGTSVCAIDCVEWNVRGVYEILWNDFVLDFFWLN